MILAFRTQTLRAVCEDDGKAVRRLGSAAAAVLRERLADLRAAMTIADLPVGRPMIGPHPGDVLTFVLAEGVRMVWKANQPKTRNLADDGSVDWTLTTRIQLLDFEGVDERS